MVANEEERKVYKSCFLIRLSRYSDLWQCCVHLFKATRVAYGGERDYEGNYLIKITYMAKILTVYYKNKMLYYEIYMFYYKK